MLRTSDPSDVYTSFVVYYCIVHIEKLQRQSLIPGTCRVFEPARATVFAARADRAPGSYLVAVLSQILERAPSTRPIGSRYVLGSCANAARTIHCTVMTLERFTKPVPFISCPAALRLSAPPMHGISCPCIKSWIVRVNPYLSSSAVNTTGATGLLILSLN